MSIRAGELKHPAIIERLPTPIDLDSAGQEKIAWEKVCDKRIAIYPLRGREYLAAQEIDSELTHKLKMRWGPEFNLVTAKYRVRVGQRLFDVQSVINISEANREIQMMAIEKGT